MSYTGLRGFLRGGRPRAATRQRLVEWYAQYRESHRAVPREDLDAAITLLGYYLREETGGATRAARFRRAIGRIAEEGQVPDSWYDEHMAARNAARSEPRRVTERATGRKRSE